MPAAQTRRFGFLMYPGFEELDLIGPWEMATMWRDAAAGPACLSVAAEAGPLTCAKGLQVVAEHGFADCPPLDYLLVPGGMAAFEQAKNPVLVDWLAGQGAACEHVLSVCTGSFLLQAAGLLEGRQASTHWRAKAALGALPGVRVSDARWTRDGAVWSSAGVSAGIDLTLAFIAAIDGDKAAEAVQLYCEYYPDGRVYGAMPYDGESPQAPPAS